MTRGLISSFSILLACATIVHSCSQSSATLQGAAVEQQTTDEFLARWKDERNRKLLGAAFWTVSHDYADYKHSKEVLMPVQLYLIAIAKHEKGDRAPLSQLEGIKAFKDRLASLLNDEDQSIRALGAVLWGISGDKAYTSHLARLLKRRGPASGGPRYDRGRAAMALGMVGAKEYTLELVNLLKSSNSFDRSGAAFGLGSLRAKDQRKAVARLLNDADENVRNAAKESLEMMREMPN